jgi:PAS domain S-box-containing protein
MFARLSTKLLLTFGSLGLITIGVTGWQSYEHAREALTAATTDRLTAIRQTKKRQIETFFRDFRRHAAVLSKHESTLRALREFQNAFPFYAQQPAAPISVAVRDFYESQFPGAWDSAPSAGFSGAVQSPESPVSLRMQHDYIVANPHPVGAKYRLNAAPGGSPYDRVHAFYHGDFYHYLESFEFYDLFLVDHETGFIVYSVTKEVDFATSLLTGPYRDTNIGRAFRAVRGAANPDALVLRDFEPYGPSHNAPAAFAAAPVYHGAEPLGVLIVQVSISEINDVMTGGANWRQEGLGETGETYVVGPDYMLRSDSRLEIEQPERFFETLERVGTSSETIRWIRESGTAILRQPMRTSAIEQALSGQTGTVRTRNYRDVDVLASYTPLDLQDLQWVLVAEIEAEEALGPVRSLQRRMIALAGVAALIFAVIGGIFSSTITGPVLEFVRRAESLGKGDLSQRIEVRSQDEIGRLAASFNRMAEDLQRTTVSKEYLDSIFSSMINSLIVTSAPSAAGGTNSGDWRVLRVNQSTTQLLGYSAGEMEGRPIDQIVAGLNDTPDWRSSLAKDGVLRSRQADYLDQGGDTIPVLLAASMLRSREGEDPQAVFVAQDIRELRRAERELRQLSGRLLSAHEEERGRLARELHDDLTQRLAALAIDTGKLHQAFPESLADEKAQLRGLKQRVVELSEDVRRMARSLHPSILDELGLIAALEAEFGEIERRDGLRVEFECGDLPQKLPQAAALCVYRVVLEALRNVVKHSDAQQVFVSVAVQGSQLEFLVEDQGRGFDPNHARHGSGLGLGSMEERVRLLGGRFSLWSEQGKGTRVHATVPWEET